MPIEPRLQDDTTDVRRISCHAAAHALVHPDLATVTITVHRSRRWHRLLHCTDCGPCSTKGDVEQARESSERRVAWILSLLAHKGALCGWFGGA